MSGGYWMTDTLALFLQGLHAPWHSDAACVGMEVAVFFPALGESTAEAIATCRRCPVRIECLEECAAGPAYLRTEGIRGGLPPRKRQRVEVLNAELARLRAERDGQTAAS